MSRKPPGSAPFGSEKIASEPTCIGISVVSTYNHAASIGLSILVSAIVRSYRETGPLAHNAQKAAPPSRALLTRGVDGADQILNGYSAIVVPIDRTAALERE